MGVQGNYPGSGAINQHKHLAMRGEAPGGGSVKSGNMDHGSGSGAEAVNLPKGKGSEGGVVINNSFGESFETGHRSGDVGSNIP